MISSHCTLFLSHSYFCSYFLWNVWQLQYNVQHKLCSLAAFDMLFCRLRSCKHAVTKLMHAREHTRLIHVLILKIFWIVSYDCWKLLLKYFLTQTFLHIYYFFLFRFVFVNLQQSTVYLVCTDYWILNSFIIKLLHHSIRLRMRQPKGNLNHKTG